MADRRIVGGPWQEKIQNTKISKNSRLAKPVHTKIRTRKESEKIKKGKFKGFHDRNTVKRYERERICGEVFPKIRPGMVVVDDDDEFV